MDGWPNRIEIKLRFQISPAECRKGLTDLTCSFHPFSISFTQETEDGFQVHLCRFVFVRDFSISPRETS